jgi:cardiolipin synthase
MAVASSGRAGPTGVLRRLLANARTLSPFYVANALTLARLLCVAPVVALVLLGEARAAFWLFAAAAATDAADGFIAKRFNGISAVGAALDPIADKLLCGGLFVALAYHGSVDAWLAALVLVRDGGLVLGAPFVRRSDPGGHIKPLIAGKASTLAQFLFLSLVLAVNAGHGSVATFLPLMQAVVVALTVISAAAYAALVLDLRRRARMADQCS